MDSYARTGENSTAYGIRADSQCGDNGTCYSVYGARPFGGTGSTLFAGYFDGNVRVRNGTFDVVSGTKNFLIDHPLDPENKTLRHSAVESPENLCMYRGKISLGSSGRKLVKLPDYFAALTKEDEATVILTPIGKEAFGVSYEWKDDYDSFTVYGEANSEVSYMVLADRDDPAIHLLKLPVEEEKGAGNFEKGQYLTPEAYENDGEGSLSKKAVGSKTVGMGEVRPKPHRLEVRRARKKGFPFLQKDDHPS